MLNKTKKIQALSKKRFYSLSKKEQALYNKRKNISRTMCPHCGRPKHRFESENEAYLFIAYHGDQMIEETGYKPERAYWCEACGAFHTTHKKQYKPSMFSIVA